MQNLGLPKDFVFPDIPKFNCAIMTAAGNYEFVAMQTDAGDAIIVSREGFYQFIYVL